MYGLDPNTSFDLLIGATLQQVCFGRHQVILNFDRNISISIESAVAIAVGASATRFDDLFASSSHLLGLIDGSIRDVSGTREGTLTLGFSDGAELSIFDTSDRFESYQIRLGDELIVV